MKNKSDLIKEMLTLQINTNNNTCGVDWVEGKTLEGRSIDWGRCIVMESVELIDCYPWKHWKNLNAPIDEMNAKIELVDIFHFLISHSIGLVGKVETLEYIELCDLDYTLHGKIEKVENVIFLVEDFILSIMRNPLQVRSLFRMFFKLCAFNNLSFTELYNLYIGKNILNEFRQANGYKTGDYVKVWLGVEDNVYMYNYQILKTDEVIKKDELMAYLSERYKKLT